MRSQAIQGIGAGLQDTQPDRKQRERITVMWYLRADGSSLRWKHPSSGTWGWGAFCKGFSDTAVSAGDTARAMAKIR